MTSLKPGSLRFSLPSFLWNRWLPHAFLIILLICTGCTQGQASKIELTMQVQPTGQAGAYTISGHTNLPDQTRITVQAVRDLQLALPSSERSFGAWRSQSQRRFNLTNSRPMYSILGRTQVNVKGGQWQTNLNLLLTSDGRLALPSSTGALETWQISDAQLGLQPRTKVMFLALTDPVNQALDVGQALSSAAQGDNLSIQFTDDGKSYLQAEQSLDVDPPNAKLATQHPVPTVVNVSVKPADASTELKKQTDAPLSPEAFAR